VQKRTVVALDPGTGKARPNALITVFNAGTLSTASLFADNEVTSLSNPLVTDLAGRTSFKAADGEYDIQVSGAGFITYTIRGVQFADKDSFQLISSVVGVHSHQDSDQGGQLNASIVFSGGTVPAIRLGTSPTDSKFLRGDSTWQSLSLPRGYMAGFKLANNAGDANNDIDISGGSTRSDDDTDDIILAGTLTKQLDTTWTPGTDTGGLDTGSKANNTHYHMFVIKNITTGDVDVLFSASLSPAMPTGFTKKRRLGTIRTDSSGNIIGFFQNGDEFLLKVPILDHDALTGGTNAVTVTLGSVPVGVQVGALFNIVNGTGSCSIYISSLETDDVAGSTTVAPGWSISFAGVGYGYRYGPVRTNTSGQIRIRANANHTFRISTLGWLDRRGRDD